MSDIQPIGILRNRTFDELRVGDCASIERSLTQDDIHLFAVLSGDFNPQHIDRNSPPPPASTA